MVQRYKKMN